MKWLRFLLLLMLPVFLYAEQPGLMQRYARQILKDAPQDAWILCGNIPLAKELSLLAEKQHSSVRILPTFPLKERNQYLLQAARTTEKVEETPEGKKRVQIQSVRALDALALPAWLEAAEKQNLPPRVCRALELSNATFVHEWLREAPQQAAEKLILIDTPGILQETGFSAVPDGWFFRVAPQAPAEQAALEALCRRTQNARDLFADWMVFEAPGAGDVSARNDWLMQQDALRRIFSLFSAQSADILSEAGLMEQADRLRMDAFFLFAAIRDLQDHLFGQPYESAPLDTLLPPPAAQWDEQSARRTVDWLWTNQSFTRAEDLVESILAKDGDKARPLLLLLADLFARQNLAFSAQNALARYEHPFRSPETFEAAILVATELSAPDLLLSALKNWRTQAESDPASPFPEWADLLEKAVSAYLKQDTATFQDAIRQAVQKSPRNASLLHWQLVCDMEQHADPIQAEVHADTLIAVRPCDSLAFFVKGMLAETRGNTDAAEENYRKSVALKPSWMVLNNLASLLANHREKSSDAVLFALKALELAPSPMAGLYDTLGETLRATHQTEAARKAFEKASELNTDNDPRIFLHLAEIYAAEENMDALKKQLPKIEARKALLSPAEQERLRAITPAE